MNTSELTDEKVAEGVLATPDMYGILIDRYEEKLTRYVSRLSNMSADEREDVLQEVFVKAYEKIASFDSHQSFNSWIYRICHNVTINYWKKNKRYNEGTSFDGEAGDLLESMFAVNNVEEELFRNSDAEEVGRALGKIKQSYKDILILRFYEEKSYEEISDILQIPAGTVATNINRAKTQLKKHITN